MHSHTSIGGAGSLPSPPSSQFRTQPISQPQASLQPSQPSHPPPPLHPLQRPLPSPGSDITRNESASQLQTPADTKQHRKRDRIRYSCTTCREKKLKCNRTSPCDQCEKRAIGASCHFVPYQNPRQDRRAKSKNKKASISPDVDAAIEDTGHCRQTELARPMDAHLASFTPALSETASLSPPSTQPLSAHAHSYHASQPAPGAQAGPHRPRALSSDPRQPGPAAHGEPLSHTSSDHQARPRQQPRAHPRCADQPGPSTRTHGASAPSPAEKLRHLESIVAALKRQIAASSRAEGEGESDGDDDGDDDDGDNDNDTSPPTPSNEFVPETEANGNIVEGSRYVASDNWEGVMGDVVKLTENLGFENSSDASDASADDHWDFGPKTTGLALLSGNFARVSVSDLFRFLPPRSTMDIMIDRFFNGKEPTWVMFHRPTFYKHYEAFWNDPRSASYTYLALLYMMLAQAAIFYLGAGEPIPGGLGDALQVIDGCRTHAAHCLAIDDYTKPDKFKVETMMLYFRTEYLRQVDAPLGTAMILSITVRLALHMGYHRDPRHFSHLTPFEGEMRRRTWAVLTEVDKLVSFEFGLPANIKAVDCDTESPRNLHDSDLYEDMAALPPSRPETEFTPVLYTICKGRMMWVFGDIMVTRMNSDALSLSRGYYEKTIMGLDRRLEAARASFGAPLKYIGAPAQATDDGNAVLLSQTPVEIVMQRCTLELLYQKVRLVLHRRFLGIARTNARFAYARTVCIDAATRILRHQYDLYVSLLPGGPLSKDKWIRNSTHTHDFLLAGMVMCLEVSYARKESADDSTSRAGQGLSHAPTPPALLEMPGPLDAADKMLELLATSCSIWEMQREASAEANRAYKILTQLLLGSTGGGARSTRPAPAQDTAVTVPVATQAEPPTVMSPEQHMMPMPVSRPIHLTTAVPPKSGPAPAWALTPNKYASLSSSSSPSSQLSAAPTLFDSAFPPPTMGGGSTYSLPTSLSPSDTLSWPRSSASISPLQHAAPPMQPSHMNTGAFETVSGMGLYQNPLAPELFSEEHANAHAHPPPQPQLQMPMVPATGSYMLAASAPAPAFTTMSMTQPVQPMPDLKMEDSTDPSYFSDWSLWDNQVQRVGLDAMPDNTWTTFFH